MIEEISQKIITEESKSLDEAVIRVFNIPKWLSKNMFLRYLFLKLNRCTILFYNDYLNNTYEYHLVKNKKLLFIFKFKYNIKII